MCNFIANVFTVTGSAVCLSSPPYSRCDALASCSPSNGDFVCSTECILAAAPSIYSRRIVETKNKEAESEWRREVLSLYHRCMSTIIEITGKTLEKYFSSITYKNISNCHSADPWHCLRIYLLINSFDKITRYRWRIPAKFFYLVFHFWSLSFNLTNTRENTFQRDKCLRIVDLYSEEKIRSFIEK